MSFKAGELIHILPKASGTETFWVVVTEPDKNKMVLVAALEKREGSYIEADCWQTQFGYVDGILTSISGKLAERAGFIQPQNYNAIVDSILVSREVAPIYKKYIRERMTLNEQKRTEKKKEKS